MPCTTLLVGRKASYDGSTLMARNEDSGGGHFTPKKLVVVRPEEQPRQYKSVISGVEIELPDDPLRYTAMPNALPEEGLWAAAGVNALNVAMTATETITTNPRWSQAASARRTLSRSHCPTSARPAREWSGSARCWKNTAPMR